MAGHFYAKIAGRTKHESRTALKQTQISHAGSLPPLGGTSGPPSGAETQRRPRGRAAPGTISARPPGPEELLSHGMRKWPWRPSKVPQKKQERIAPSCQMLSSGATGARCRTCAGGDLRQQGMARRGQSAGRVRARSGSPRWLNDAVQLSVCVDAQLLGLVLRARAETACAQRAGRLTGKLRVSAGCSAFSSAVTGAPSLPACAQQAGRAVEKALWCDFTVKANPPGGLFWRKGIYVKIASPR
jgi:hypothetical protein